MLAAAFAVCGCSTWRLCIGRSAMATSGWCLLSLRYGYLYFLSSQEMAQ